MSSPKTPSADLTEESLEHLLKDFPEHEWDAGKYFCIHCGASLEQVQDGFVDTKCVARVKRITPGT